MGQMVSEAILAADGLESRGLSVRVVNVSTLKPVDEAALLDAARGTWGIVTAEEHSIIGGLASVVSFAFRGEGIPLRCVGIADEFGQSAHSYRELQEAYGLTAEHIAECVLALAECGSRAGSR